MDKLLLINTNSEMEEQNFISMKMEKFRNKALTQETEESFFMTSKETQLVNVLLSIMTFGKERESITQMMLVILGKLNIPKEENIELKFILKDSFYSYKESIFLV